MDPMEYGEMPNQGERTDLTVLITAIKSGRRLEEIGAEDPNLLARNLNFGKFMRDARSNAIGTRNARWLVNTSEGISFTEHRVIVLYGSSGTGKSSCARSIRRYPIGRIHDYSFGTGSPGTCWFDGYVGQDVLLLDEFSGKKEDMPYRVFLRLTDRYSFRVQTKGSTVVICPLVIIITSNLHPVQWYQEETDREPLMRRIKQLVQFSKEKCELAEFPALPVIEDKEGEEF